MAQLMTSMALRHLVRGLSNSCPDTKDFGLPHTTKFTMLHETTFIAALPNAAPSSKTHTTSSMGSSPMQVMCQWTYHLCSLIDSKPCGVSLTRFMCASNQ
eukprot:6316987-Amphidinium_carterae.1